MVEEIMARPRPNDSPDSEMEGSLVPKIDTKNNVLTPWHAKYTS